MVPGACWRRCQRPRPAPGARRGPASAGAGPGAGARRLAQSKNLDQSNSISGKSTKHKKQNTQPMRSRNKSATGKSQEIIRCTHANTCLFVHIAKKRTGWSTCPQEFIQNKSVEFVYFLRLFAKARGQVDLSVQTNQTNK